MGLEVLFEKCGKAYSKNSIICRDKEKDADMFLILSGQVRIYKQGPPPLYKVINIATLGNGDFFGEMSLLERLPRSANVQAVTDVKLLVLNAALLKQIIGMQPEFAMKMLKKFSERLRKIEDAHFDMRKK